MVNSLVGSKLPTSLIMKHLIYLSIFIAACSNAEQTTQENAVKKTFPSNWIIGKWKAQDSTTTLVETWSKLNDSTLQSFVWTYVGSDSILSETLQIEFNNQHTVFKPIQIGNQTDIKIAFELKSNDSNELIFENVKNDFPQRVSYKKINNDSIVATISNFEPKDSNNRVVSWGYKRVK